ncbi:MAG: Flp pilus assembly complex ATPase component TadA [Alphaproteobacteria bacterium]|nr:Flp pilus assembly complex ATPase component TadA [Alphaproteobacteria bacterium]MBN2675410.1 Flp pilus assembly complex ATPase component TadA [Alphaproteobacteria bacterium]
MSNAVLESLLKPLEEFYRPSFVEEIAINHAGEVWMRLHGARVPWVAYNSEKLSKQYLLDLIHTVANIYERPFDPIRGMPVVYATLPGSHRFTAIAGPNVQYDDRDITGGVALNIRGGGVGDVPFENYHLKKGSPLLKVKPRNKKKPDDPYEKLMQAINDGSPILISGATSTGKTTFLNHMLTLIDQNSRVITVEDAREITVPQKNRVHFVLSRTEQTNDFNYARLLDLVVRMTPDVIIGGEVSTDNASVLWEMMGTGHDHFYTTIHAESADAAYAAFADRILHTQPAYERSELMTEMKNKLRVVQLSRDGALRAVTEVV